MAGSPRVGVLALQGDVREHAALLTRLGAQVELVRRPEELAAVNGLVIPGGESTVIDKLSRTFGMQEPIRDAIAAGLPVLGTCAGLIMLADTVVDAIEGQQSFGGLDAVVRRNAFGRQVESFEAQLDVAAFGAPPVSAAFIRGPVVESIGPRATPLAALPDGRVVAVEQGALLGLSFHPEISGETRFHERFLARVEGGHSVAAA
ncbi:MULTISPECIES: pyridoxal 5'-phosphate synthase glutaminase subunit PdxT [Microbacterium]|uniref:Pyridoxal 5'-phosphate synthase subunit PdxT n=1 Tax=Microbacterium sufflavum TaxID=2851649 RepID=A0ABY4IHC5_9MICO|nr:MULTISPECIES: pyridoxal 5'-phosphate synthase glutaminase subunit PdxT [Microbacterium]MBN6189695.1 pyridoxal 5'-phosphate synthase glutaminase subunit PdxT [Aneurinibacillus sp. BA2021]MCK2027442.1 pyridoxal 5'-phosphate synthase glutaminase subunit PdxT [Microbacterium sufflavum]UPL12166.1 pyridoxal 5'-phosphate synthase glutaminase subunit PdxT [Microbacterium sufflavum]